MLTAIDILNKKIRDVAGGTTKPLMPIPRVSNRAQAGKVQCRKQHPHTLEQQACTPAKVLHNQAPECCSSQTLPGPSLREICHGMEGFSLEEKYLDIFKSHQIQLSDTESEINQQQYDIFPNDKPACNLTSDARDKLETRPQLGTVSHNLTVCQPSEAPAPLLKAGKTLRASAYQQVESNKVKPTFEVKSDPSKMRRRTHTNQYIATSTIFSSTDIVGLTQRPALAAANIDSGPELTRRLPAMRSDLPSSSLSNVLRGTRGALLLSILSLLLLSPLGLLYMNGSGASNMRGASGGGLRPAGGRAAGPMSWNWVEAAQLVAGVVSSRGRSVRAEAAAGLAGSAGEIQPDGGEGGWLPGAEVRAVIIVPGNAESPYRTSWGDLAKHTAQRLSWTDPSFQLRVFYEEELKGGGVDSGNDGAQAVTQLTKRSELQRALLSNCQLVLGFGLSDPSLLSWMSSLSSPTQKMLPGITLFLDSHTAFDPLVQLPGGFSGAARQSWLDRLLAQKVSFGPQAKSAELFSTLKTLLGRRNSDDFLFIFLVLIDQFIRPVPEVSMTTKGFDLGSIYCMIKNCGNQVKNCVTDEKCKAGLDCLQACSFNDQVCQYRCIVSHETPQMEQFSLCILQKHNCRNLDAQIPMRPDPAPMTSFRGQPLSHDIAEDMLCGWMQKSGSTFSAASIGSNPLPCNMGGPEVKMHNSKEHSGSAAAGGDNIVHGDLPYSWLVAAGKNPAYDYFPAQHQLFYRGKGKGVLWYEPVFKVITLSGEQVWRRRKYRVKRGKVPGTFYFTVLDNGVTSNEFWRVLDCNEGLEWCLFYYSGAAATAGLSYSGAVLATRTGGMPADSGALTRLESALDTAGIKMWELSTVDNRPEVLLGAPLDSIA
ncbi:hypothetical protein CEUSTIGMA_g8010.t1 [Chlamydomonas eustigma]|uniref:VDE lipocalin domain-containing protein n=1 Tax=Chlamydomonas eustigma TaxID=1157962 RepID=A0A250XBX1_9CHLO|nr:hypothetical protein CEUSTIGMA_g8010.t1 [Chlamydomonas eustigma]|eukprot:GAX80573.1 hypothetical protein CEUSTIGMA_g8010.t1 [Chlamydomonas eustigma]